MGSICCHKNNSTIDVEIHSCQQTCLSSVHNQDLTVEEAVVVSEWHQIEQTLFQIMVHDYQIPRCLFQLFLTFIDQNALIRPANLKFKMLTIKNLLSIPICSQWYDENIKLQNKNSLLDCTIATTKARAQTDHDKVSIGHGMDSDNGSLNCTIILLGWHGVGKNCIAKRFVTNEFDSDTFHLCDECHTYKKSDYKLDDLNFNINIIVPQHDHDIGFGYDFDSILTMNPNVICCVCNLCSHCTLVDIVINYEQLQEKMKIKEERESKFNYVIVGTSCDDISSGNRQISCDELIQEGKEIGSPVIFTSAQTGDNIDILFEFCVKYWWFNSQCHHM